MALIEERVELARRGKNPAVMCQLSSGWAVIALQSVREMAPDYLEHARPEVLNDQDQPELPWDG